jgi:hypothetical protein
MPLPPASDAKTPVATMMTTPAGEPGIELSDPPRDDKDHGLIVAAPCVPAPLEQALRDEKTEATGGEAAARHWLTIPKMC